MAIAVVATVVIVLIAIWQRSSDAAWAIVFVAVCLGALAMFVLHNASGRGDDAASHDPDQEP